MGAKIVEVFPESIAEELGIFPGDEILSINGKILRDIFDYKFLIQEKDVEIEVKQGNKIHIYEIEKLPEEDLGVEFDSPIFDNIKRCQNSCIFCFIDQLPKGLRPSLYVKDDDYRLSFLYGNYITLTNVKEEDLNRIIRYRLSPLYISVHSTVDEIRLKLIRNRKALSIREKLSYLIDNGIFLNIQIVLIPEINDKDILKKTIYDLYKLHKGILSVAIVPVGLTRFRKGLYPIRKFRKEEIILLVEQIEEFQKEFREKIKRGFVYLADEFFLEAGLEIPDISYYDALNQIEDGVGMTRVFIDETKESLKGRKKNNARKEIGIVTGVLGKKVLGKVMPYILEVFPHINLSIIEVKNKFFGEDITVTGLLTARDIKNALSYYKGKSEEILIPDIVLNDNSKFLDDVYSREFIESFSFSISFVNISPSAFIKKLNKEKKYGS